MIFEARDFGESFVCEKAEFCESTQILICLHSVNPCLIYRGKLRFLKNHRNGSSVSLCKIERGEFSGGCPYKGGGGGKQCFSLVMYGLCGNNALYSANLYSCLFSF